MFEKPCLMFYSDFGRLREPPIDGLFFKNSRNGEWANENLPFFVWRGRGS